MNSEFLQVELNQLRYSVVWEDNATLFSALNISSTDNLLIITSAGCNVLNALLKNPAKVVAIDINPVQNKLLLLKKHIILHHDYPIYKSLLGLNGVEQVNSALQQLLQTLQANEKAFWCNFFSTHPAGILTAGKLEKYITGFYKTLPSKIQQRLTELISFDTPGEQYEYFVQHLDSSSFKEMFIGYFDDENLSKGRDPKLLKYATESGGVAFYNRLKKQIKWFTLKDNFYFRFFFFGPLNLPGSILPPCQREENYGTLQEQLHKLEVVNGEAIDYLLTPGGAKITKASLSNIFEYTSKSEFEQVCQSLSKRDLRAVFWNLLNNQGADFTTSGRPVIWNEVPPSSHACFYFKNVMSLQFNHSHKTISAR